MNVAAAMDLPQICKDDDTWAQELRSAVAAEPLFLES